MTTQQKLELIDLVFAERAKDILSGKTKSQKAKLKKLKADHLEFRDAIQRASKGTI